MARAKWSKGDRMLLDDFLKAGKGLKTSTMEGAMRLTKRTWMKTPFDGDTSKSGEGYDCYDCLMFACFVVILQPR